LSLRALYEIEDTIFIVLIYLSMSIKFVILYMVRSYDPISPIYAGFWT
jgi:hypothetical protein